MNKKGYSLIELAVVMSIIAVVFAFSVSFLSGARRQQELVSVKNALIDLIREAKNTSLSTGGTEKVIAANIQSPNTAALVSYIPCGVQDPPPHLPSCSPTPIKNPNLFSGSNKIESIADRGGVLINPLYIFFSVPYGKACIVTTSPSSISRLFDEQYPINSERQDIYREDGGGRCLDTADNFVYITLERTDNTNLKSRIKINTHSGDVSDA